MKKKKYFLLGIICTAAVFMAVFVYSSALNFSANPSTLSSDYTKNLTKCEDTSEDSFMGILGDEMIKLGEKGAKSFAQFLITFIYK